MWCVMGIIYYIYTNNKYIYIYIFIYSLRGLYYFLMSRFVNDVLLWVLSWWTCEFRQVFRQIDFQCSLVWIHSMCEVVCSLNQPYCSFDGRLMNNVVYIYIFIFRAQFVTLSNNHDCQLPIHTIHAIGIFLFFSENIPTKFILRWDSPNQKNRMCRMCGHSPLVHSVQRNRNYCYDVLMMFCCSCCCLFVCFVSKYNDHLKTI